MGVCCLTQGTQSWCSVTPIEVGDEVKIPDENVNFQSFLGDQGLPKLNFVQLWDSEVITYDNESFETLVPGKSLFAGFVKNNK